VIEPPTPPTPVTFTKKEPVEESLRVKRETLLPPLDKVTLDTFRLAATPEGAATVNATAPAKSFRLETVIVELAFTPGREETIPGTAKMEKSFFKTVTLT
jgi:hypothetical protein